MEQNLKALPRLTFSEAVKKGLKDICKGNGRSRRSEFWWFMLAVWIVEYIVSFTTSSIPLVATLVSIVFLCAKYNITRRRVMDSGHSPIWVLLCYVANLVVIVFTYCSGMMDAMNTINPNFSEMAKFASSPLLWIPSLVSLITGIACFIFALQDSDPEENKYGVSPKYVSAEQ